MKYDKKNLIIVILVFVLIVSKSFSIGLGFYVPLTGASSSEYIEDGPEWGAKSSSYGFGLVMDTKLANDKLFNYRLNIGYHHITSEADYNLAFPDNNNFGYDNTQHKLVFDNTFGFGIVRNDFMRLWMGPQLRWNFEFADGTAESYGLSNFNTLSYNHFEFGLGLAPVIGLNFNIGSVLSLCTDFGYRYSAMLGFTDYETPNSFGYINSESSNKYSLEGEYFINFSVMFRINDNFLNNSSSKKKRR